MPRLYLDLPLASGAALSLPEDAARHVQVLRLQPGDALTVFDGRGGEYAATVTHMGKRTVEIAVGDHTVVERESPLEIILVQAIAAAERMDYAIQKATELGVTRIVPVNSAYTQGRMAGERAEKRRAHWQGVAAAACEQSGRTRVPDIALVQDLPTLLATPPSVELKLLLSPRGTATLATLPTKATGIALLVGPEGGLSPDEEASAIAAGWTGLALGPRVLRTETAGATLIALLQARYGDF
ncbi:16S rRNA (uracil(1498)-N(3))-methyltransferase [Chitiniphilus eburneus]|uniref:Ribosomal RNA small subunit methyltransferase E n=1 Tax=Chitiniphilus eburneus TaxID=2571148 RepID=A0A4U0Q841_9NEIS|nr:16S rRNA (uracil(1498)-N(3))-methyltransferase [Chitiniphilus eburneus]TJZ77431.1 16S rRNA (uracil(1498)-N(3))-methyltransferase [Chitiniphilus eburneus]